MKYPKFSYIQGRWCPHPPQNIPFFAYLHELEKVKKKCENDPNLSRSPPHPKCEISPFFFWLRRSLIIQTTPLHLKRKNFLDMFYLLAFSTYWIIKSKTFSSKHSWLKVKFRNKTFDLASKFCYKMNSLGISELYIRCSKSTFCLFHDN